METLWFLLVALMLTAYVVMDGFDLGVGILHLAVARSGEERRLVLRSIGPVWDGNEVWLLAAGGTLYFAFPLLYASSFSGFYLPLMMVLWLLMLRGIGIEFRTHLHNPLWQSFYDAVFCGSSALLAIFLGAALGNVIRGVPLDASGYFFEPLWTNFTVQAEAGILDWYTVLCGVLALAALAQHGALYLATKTEGALQARARKAAAWAWPLVVLLSVVGLIATLRVRPQMADNYRGHPWGFLLPILVGASLGAMLHFRLRGSDRSAFLASAAYLVGMLGGAAFGLYPQVLPASTDPSYSLTITNTAAPAYGLRIGLIWWCFGMALAIGYFVFLYRRSRGKVKLEAGEEGY
ncbi:MAG TPA: cytochrome d ubiquinol oxidase subunit II [Terriglobales bacterium]|nr:cytochrome d ubiquinol oxidase subunit II [Terriglobales bacterium]